MEKIYTWDKTFFDNIATAKLPKSKLVSSDKDAVCKEMKENLISDLRSLVYAERDFDVLLDSDNQSITVNIPGCDKYLKYNIVEIVSKDPDRIKLEHKIMNMSELDLIELINDTTDHGQFPDSWVSSVDNEDAWNELAKHLGGARFKSVLEISGFCGDAIWFFYNSEEYTIEYFRDKYDLIKYFDIDNLIDELACRE